MAPSRELREPLSTGSRLGKLTGSKGKYAREELTGEMWGKVELRVLLGRRGAGGKVKFEGTELLIMLGPGY
jgi:hypothetical protein